MIASIKFETTSTTYSLTGKLEFDINKVDEKNILYDMFVAYNCKDCSTVPLAKYKNNEIFQKITPEDDFTTNARDDRILIDMRRRRGYADELEKLNRDDSGLAIVVKLKEAVAKKFRVRITCFSQEKYWYVFSNKGYIM